MVAADGARSRNPPKTLPEMSLPQRIDELVRRLRDYRFDDYTNRDPDRLPPPDDEDTRDDPLIGLIRIGYPAVPRLIAALDDGRYSRSVPVEPLMGRSYIPAKTIDRKSVV